MSMPEPIVAAQTSGLIDIRSVKPRKSVHPSTMIALENLEKYGTPSLFPKKKKKKKY